MSSVDFRVFTEGTHKSHIYVAGESRAICGSQELGKDSSDLPKLEDVVVSDLCKLCSQNKDDSWRFD